MRRSDRDLHHEIDRIPGIADAFALTAPSVIFERHPAAIELHLVGPTTADAPAWVAVTWFPHWDAEPAHPADLPVEAAPEPIVIHDPAPPFLPPEVPEHPVCDQAPVAGFNEPSELLDQDSPQGMTDVAPAYEHRLLEPPARRPVRRFGVPALPRLPRVRLGRRAALGGLGVILAVAAVTALVQLVSGDGSGVSAVFNAPMLVVRAKVAGRVMTVPATAGQIVRPDSPLLTLHVDQADGPDRTIQAGVHGVIRSVETVPGADLAAGAALVRLQDCDRAFLTVGHATALQAGQTVRVVMPNLPPMTGTVRASAGVMEPPDTLVVALPAGSLATSCPVGTEGSVTAAPDATGSRAG